jgi:hypothetical protein
MGWGGRIQGLQGSLRHTQPQQAQGSTNLHTTKSHALARPRTCTRPNRYPLHAPLAADGDTAPAVEPAMIVPPPPGAAKPYMRVALSPSGAVSEPCVTQARALRAQ